VILANLSRRKGRTILTLAGITIGVAAMVALVLGALGGLYPAWPGNADATGGGAAV
jgi:hypothetical protein